MAGKESTLFRDRKKALIAAGVFYLVLLGIWAALEIFAMPLMQKSFSDRMLEIIKEFALKLPIWFFPAFILSRRFDSDMYANKKEIFSVKKKHLLYLLIIVPFLLFHAVSSIRTNGTITINSSFSALDIVIALSVGLCEEMVFRGFLLNTTLRENKNNAAAIIINAVLFVLIHFPVWYRTGTLVNNLQSGAFIQVLVLSIIFSYVFMKTKSIVMPAALHMCWDVLCFMQ